MRRKFGASRTQGLGHLTQDMRAATLGLLKRLGHDFLGDARDLDVHLQRGDARFSTGHLEVHVTEVILVAQDVRKDGEVFAFEDQAHRDARDRTLDGNACVHHRKTAAAHRGHRRGAVGLGDVGQHADRVGEVFLLGQHGVERAPGQLAVADFAAARSAEATHFTDRVGREVVVQHERRVSQAFKAVDHLFRVLGAQRGGADRLRFTAREQRRTVRARQEAGHRLDRADLIQLAAIDALAVLEDGGTHDFGFELLHGLDGDHLGLRGFLREGFLGLGARFVERVRASRLVGQLVGSGNVLADSLLELGLDVRGVVREIDLPGFLGGLLGEVDDQVDNLLRFLVSEHDSAEHFLFGQFTRFRFDHHDGSAGGGDDEVETAFFQRSALLGIEHVFAIDEADAAGADRTHERHARNGESGRSGDHRNDVSLGFAVIAHDLGNDVDFVVEAFREQRAHRTVDQAAGQRFLFGRAAFTLEEAAGDTASRRELFLVVNGEREEVLPFLHRLCSGDRAKHNGFAISGEDGTIRLAGDAAGFESEGLAAPLHRYGLDVEHVYFLSPSALLPDGVFLAGDAVPVRYGAVSCPRPLAGLRGYLSILVLQGCCCNPECGELADFAARRFARCETARQRRAETWVVTYADPASGSDRCNAGRPSS